MASGSFSGSYGGYTIRTDWSSTTNIEGNYSTITCNHYLICGSGWDLYIGTRSNSCTVYGETKEFTSPDIQTAGNSTHHIGTTTHVVPHNSEGKKTTEGTTVFNINANISGSSVSSITTDTGTMVLDDIPRASTFGGVTGSSLLDSNRTISITRNSDSFTHTLTYSCGDITDTVVDTDGVSIEKSTDTTIVWKQPLILASQNTTGTTVSVKLTLDTYSGDTKIGTKTKTIRCSIPSKVKPSCDLTIEDAEGYADTYGGYIQGLSKLKVTVDAESFYGATIKSYNTTVSNTAYTASSFTTGIINNAGTLNVSTTVTDTRERTATDSVDVTVLEYSKPKISKFTVHRCNADGIEDQNGGYVKITYSCGITSLDSKNKATAKIRYKKTTDNDSNYITIIDAENTTIPSVTDRIIVFEADTGSSYDVELTLYDNFDHITKSTSVSTAFTFHHYKGPDEGVVGKNLYNVHNSYYVSDNVTIDADGWVTATFAGEGDWRMGYNCVYTSKWLSYNKTYYFVTEIKEVSGEGELYVCNATSLTNDNDTDKGQFINDIVYSLSSLKAGDILRGTATTRDSFANCGTMLKQYCGFPTTSNPASVTYRVSIFENEEDASNFVYSPFEIVGECEASMGLGKMAELEGGLDIGFYTRFNEGIKPIHMLKGADFNNCNTPGNIYVGNYYLASGDYLNAPDTLDYIFIVIVHKAGSTESVLRQEFIGCSRTNPKHFERYCFSGTWGEWLDMNVLTAKNIYPVGSKYITNSSTNPSSYLGGTWTQERILYGGELIAYATVLAVNDSRVELAADTELGFGDSRNGTKTHDITNYIDGILVAGNGAIKVNTKGIVGMVEANMTISGMGGVAFWFMENNNALPDGITLLPFDGNAAMLTVGASGHYGGNTHNYIYKVEDGLDTTFAVNPKYYTYGGSFYPSCDGVKSFLIVKAYAKHAKSYMWRRTA